MVSSKQILADVGKFVGRDHNKHLLEGRVAIVSFLLWHMVNQLFFVKSVKQKESGREFSEDSLKYTEKFLKTLKIQVVPEVGNSHT